MRGLALAVCLALAAASSLARNLPKAATLFADTSKDEQSLKPRVTSVSIRAWRCMHAIIYIMEKYASYCEAISAAFKLCSSARSQHFPRAALSLNVKLPAALNAFSIVDSMKFKMASRQLRTKLILVSWNHSALYRTVDFDFAIRTKSTFPVSAASAHPLARMGSRGVFQPVGRPPSACHFASCSSCSFPHAKRAKAADKHCSGAPEEGRQPVRDRRLSKQSAGLEERHVSGEGGTLHCMHYLAPCMGDLLLLLPVWHQ